MSCADFRSWLDDGMPSAATATARAHAASCAACARELAAAMAVERALAMPAPVPPSGPDTFVASVLDTIGDGSPDTPTAADRIPVPDAARRPWRLWWGLLAEPSFVAGAATLLAVLALPAAMRDDAGRGAIVAATVGSNALNATFSNAASAVLASLSLPSGLHPYAIAFLMFSIGAPLLWAGLWGVGAVDRWLRQGTDRRT